jgi:hypothetical protein
MTNELHLSTVGDVVIHHYYTALDAGYGCIAMMGRRDPQARFCVQRFEKAPLFLVIFWSLLVNKMRSFVRFTSVSFANLRIRSVDALSRNLLSSSWKALE